MTSLGLEDIAESEKTTLQEDVIKKKIKEIIENCLKGKEYDETKVPQWISNICEACIESLYAPKKPFKYAVTCTIMQRTGAGIHSANACYWDTVSDVALSVSWPKQKSRDPSNRSMLCMVTVFAVSFYPS
eukprot:TRINITY_DN927_c8_g1_i1.p1 TRINITY_DN927_c8_g1~~TRINITY_DN927_c8_g1_i1.p1  ORF type:complete len:130 (+),score=14.75 TRINITY_DN927_c8_g1_i1:139-528(+)